MGQVIFRASAILRETSQAIGNHLGPAFEHFQKKINLIPIRTMNPCNGPRPVLGLALAPGTCSEIAMNLQ